MPATHVTLVIAITVLVLICIGLVLVVRMDRRQGELVQATEELIKEVEAERLQRALEEPRVNGHKRPPVETSITRKHLGLVKKGVMALAVGAGATLREAWNEHPRAAMASAASILVAGTAGTAVFLGGPYTTEKPVNVGEPRPAASAPRGGEQPSQSASRPLPSTTPSPSMSATSSPSTTSTSLPVPTASPTATGTSMPTETAEPSLTPSQADPGPDGARPPAPGGPGKPDRSDRGEGRPGENGDRPGTGPGDDGGEEDREDGNDSPGHGSDQKPCLIPVDVPLGGLLDGLLCAE